MFPVYSVTYVPGPYPVLRSLGLLNVLYEYACGGLGRDALSAEGQPAALQFGRRNKQHKISRCSLVRFSCERRREETRPSSGAVDISPSPFVSLGPGTASRFSGDILIG